MVGVRGKLVLCLYLQYITKTMGCKLSLLQLLHAGSQYHTTNMEYVVYSKTFMNYFDKKCIFWQTCIRVGNSFHGIVVVLDLQKCILRQMLLYTFIQTLNFQQRCLW